MCKCAQRGHRILQHIIRVHIRMCAPMHIIFMCSSLYLCCSVCFNDLPHSLESDKTFASPLDEICHICSQRDPLTLSRARSHPRHLFAIATKLMLIAFLRIFSAPCPDTWVPHISLTHAILIIIKELAPPSFTQQLSSPCPPFFDAKKGHFYLSINHLF